ncbi:MAG: hypothetical protein RRY54_07745 [Angelakisella sp.]
MIKRVALTIITIFAGVATGVLLALAGRGESFAAIPPSSASRSSEMRAGEIISQSSGVSVPSVSEGYFIKEYNGRVSVIKDGCEVPEMIFDIQTKLLPELDRKQLAQGIYVKTYEELARLVEDYIS